MDTGSTNTDGDPLVSIVVPVYERTDLLPDSLNSILEQTYENWETIVVADHHSADEVIGVVDEYGDNRFRIIVDDSDGVSEARNVGIDAAKGVYIAFLDSDDVWHPTKLEQQLRRFNQGPESLGLVYTGFVHDELDGERWERHPQVSGDVYLKELEKDWIHPPSTVMVTSETLSEVGDFNTNLPTREDYELWLRVTEHFIVDYVADLLVTKREQSDSLSKDFDQRIEGDLAVYNEVRRRTEELDFGALRRHRIHSTHHLVIGRDYESNGNRRKAVFHLSRAVTHYPLQVNAWAMLVIALFGINRNGWLLTQVKRILWS